MWRHCQRSAGRTDSQPAGMFTRRRAPLSCRACAPATPGVQEELHATQCARRQRAKNRNSVALLAAGYTLERLPNLHNCGEERVDPCTYAVFHSSIVRLLCVYVSARRRSCRSPCAMHELLLSIVKWNESSAMFCTCTCNAATSSSTGTLSTKSL